MTLSLPPLDPVAAKRLRANLAEVRGRIESAAVAAGRRSDDVTLVAVTKYVEPSVAAALVEAGCDELGESRPQQLWTKADALAGRSVRWHQIGHMQRNKVDRTLPLVDLLHAGDSLRLLTSWNRAAQEAGRIAEVLLEVNISGEPEKHGFQPSELAEVIRRVGDLDQLRVRGLMAMSGRGSSPSEATRQFAAVRQLRDALRDDCPPHVDLVDLSLGMSGDFEQAIAEGATIVRVGSALYEGVV